MTSLSTSVVQDLVKVCLYHDDETDADGHPKKDQPEPLQVEGAVSRFGFHPGRIKAQEDRIRELLGELSPEFADGHSLMVACNDKDGRQWTSYQLTVDELFCLGMAIGAVEFCAPREMWPMLPHGMPYLRITL